MIKTSTKFIITIICLFSFSVIFQESVESSQFEPGQSDCQFVEVNILNNIIGSVMFSNTFFFFQKVKTDFFCNDVVFFSSISFNIKSITYEDTNNIGKNSDNTNQKGMVYNKVNKFLDEPHVFIYIFVIILLNLFTGIIIGKLFS